MPPYSLGFFQESASEGVNSVTANAALIKKIYFPREVFPLTAMVTKLVELSISFLILAGLMVYYKIMPTLYACWIPAIIFYRRVIALTISLFGAAMNVILPGYFTSLAGCTILAHVWIAGHLSVEPGPQNLDQRTSGWHLVG